jgi:hypothetical protein
MTTIYRLSVISDIERIEGGGGEIYLMMILVPKII